MCAQQLRAEGAMKGKQELSPAGLAVQFVSTRNDADTTFPRAHRLVSEFQGWWEGSPAFC